MRYRFLDVHGFAGGFSCGATLAGMELAGKVEDKSAFGTALLEANREFLGDDWQAQAADPKDWQPIPADIVIGTPPCSAFSGMTSGYSSHGAESHINHCMWDLIEYASRVRPAVVVMESVGQAYTRGVHLMQALHADLEKRTRLAYQATHILQDNYSCGGVTKRRRYFLVLSQVPFGVELPELKWLPTVADALGDLRSQPLSWEAQPYASAPTWWSHHLRSASGEVDGHHEPREHNHRQRLTDLTDKVEWLPGEKESHVLKRYYDAHGELPESWRYKSSSKTNSHLTRDKQLIDRGLDPGGFAQIKRWDWDMPGRVLTGAGPYQVWHPDNRFLTHREAARIMGFPDDWKVGNSHEDRRLHGFWGKGTSVAPAEWVMNWVRASLDGEPGSVKGDDAEDGSRVINITARWKDVWKRQARGVAMADDREPEDAETVVTGSKAARASMLDPFSLSEA